MKRMVRVGLGLLFGLLLLAVGGSAGRVTASGPITNLFFGMDDGGVLVGSANNVALAQGTGAGFVRVGLFWSQIEPQNTTPDQFNWQSVDPAMQRLLTEGLTPLVILMDNPAWAATTPCGPVDTTNPAMLAEFSQFVGAAAGHYPQVKIWTLYNEADNSKGVPGSTGGCFGDDITGDLNNNGVPDYAEYAIMTAAARDAVRQANPDARVAFAVAFDDFDLETCPPGYPGCSSSGHFNYHFMLDLFGYIANNPRPDGAPYADMLTFTYYDIYGPFWERQPSGAGQHGIQAKAAAIRQRMRDAGLSLPLFVSETGDDSNPDWLGSDGQSKCLAISFVRGMAVDLQAIDWWTFQDKPQRDWFYGVVDIDSNLKPSYTAYQTLTRELTGWTFQKQFGGSTNIEGYQFVKGDKKRVVVWSAVTTDNGRSPCAFPRTSRLVTFRAKRLQVVDMYGNVVEIRDNRKGDKDPRRGYIRFKVDGTPRYVSLNP